MDDQQVKKKKRKPLYRRKWFIWTVASVLVVLTAAVCIAQYLLDNASPIIRQRVVDTLSAHFHSPVQLDDLHISVIQGLQVSGRGLRIDSFTGPSPVGPGPTSSGPANSVAPANLPVRPMLIINSFQFRMELSALWHKSNRVATVYVHGMRLDIPPHQDRGNLIPPDHQPAKQPAISILVDKLVCTDTTLILETNHPGKVPMEFDISHLTLYDVGADKPFRYDATLLNPKPLGDIHSTGNFGPWESDDPRSTHADGNYTFSNANLGTINGIGGTLSSDGRFEGPLERLTVDGETDVPNFTLDTANHPVPLHTWFHAFVDGTTGDTTLSPVKARLLHSYFTASGTVKKVPTAPGQSGHDIVLDVVMDGGRIEDMLQLAVKSEPPLMRGGFAMKTKLHIPPGRESVSRKLQLNGNFSITAVTFTNAKFQDDIDGFSARAQGHAEEAKAHDTSVVASSLGGNFVMGNAQVQLSTLRFQMPGADVTLDGLYTFADQGIDLHGIVRTQATVSQMVTGWKSLLLMPADPFFRKNGAGTQVHVKVSGTKSDIHFGLDLGQKDAKRNAKQQEEQPSAKPAVKPPQH